MFIRYNSGHEVVEYAAAELERLLRKMDPMLDIIPVGTGARLGDDCITLALLEELKLSTEGVKDSFIDDLIDIDIDNMRGYIAGSNERSILLGVYKFLTSAGCAWPYPGDDNEIIPEREMEHYSYKYRKTADHPFRGEAIEGAISYSNVRDTIRWLPKIGMNMFMLEQIVPFNYISRWYTRQANTKVSVPNPLTFEQVSEMIPVLEHEVKRCGVQLHSVGHGFMFEPYGIHYKTFADKYELSDYARSHCAMINGKRELFHGSPNFTQLCYSNPEARKNIVDFIVEYAKRKPYIDFFHIWLADATNNHCECENCIKKTPSDWYVILLNEIEKALKDNGIDMRFVFILYTDTLWAPEEQKLENPEHFTLLSTLSRNYFDSTIKLDRTPVEEMPRFVRNSANGDFAISEKLTALDIWREQFSGNSFLYEYYFYTSHYNDPGYCVLAKNIYEDVHRNETMSFNGIISDQTQRSFFPTGFPLYLLSRALFDKSLTYAQIVAEYFPSAYGEDGMKLYEYLEKISASFDPKLLSQDSMSVVEEDTNTGLSKEKRRSPWQNNAEYAEKLSHIAQIVYEFEPIVDKNLFADDKARAKAWNYIRLHGEYIKKLADVLILGAEGRIDEMKAASYAIIDWISENEMEIQTQFDLCLFEQWLRGKTNYKS